MSWFPEFLRDFIPKTFAKGGRKICLLKRVFPTMAEKWVIVGINEKMHVVTRDLSKPSVGNRLYNYLCSFLLLLNYKVFNINRF